MTVKYDTNNTLALSIIQVMLQAGVFDIKFNSEESTNDLDDEQDEKEAFLYTSKINASKIFSQYL